MSKLIAYICGLVISIVGWFSVFLMYFEGSQAIFYMSLWAVVNTFAFLIPVVISGAMINKENEEKIEKYEREKRYF